MRLRPILASLACLLLMHACGSGGGDISLGSGTPTGNLTVRLGSDSFPGYNQVVLGIEKVEGSTNGTTWTLLGNVKSTVDLMLLQNGNSAAILSAVAASPATYTQFRITWATVDYYDANGSWPSFVGISGNTAPLAMPANTVLNGSVKVTTAGTTVLLMLSGQQALQIRSNSYRFQATGSAFDQSATARLTGRLADGTTALTGVEVYAETVDNNGLATLQRRAFTGPSGNYTLEGLPTGSQYYLVAQPASSNRSYRAQASAAVNAAAATTYTADLSFSSPLTPAHLLTIVVTPPSTATQVTWVELRKTITIGGTSQSLIVRSQTLDVSLTQESTGLLYLYPDSYDVAAQRSTSGATPVKQLGSPSLVTLSGGETTTVIVNYP